jgi:hypothetical protein
MRYVPTIVVGLIVLNTSTPQLRAQETSGPVQFIAHDTAFTFMPTDTTAFRVGDAEFDSHGPDVRAEAVVGLLPDGLGVYLCLYFRATETGGDKSEAKGWKKLIPLGFVESGYRGVAVRTPARAELDTLTHGKNATIVHPVQIRDENTGEMRNPLVRTWRVYGDTDGDDIGRYTRLEVILNTIEINRFPESGTIRPDSTLFDIYSCEGLTSARDR